MTQAAVAADVHQALDVHGNFAAKIALYLEVVIDIVAQLTDFLLGQILDSGIGIDTGRFNDIVRNIPANAIDIRQGDLDSLFSGKVDTCDTCHLCKAPPTSSCRFSGSFRLRFPAIGVTMNACGISKGTRKPRGARPAASHAIST